MTRRAIHLVAVAVSASAAMLGGCSSPILGSAPSAQLAHTGRYHVVEGLDVPEVGGLEHCGAQALAAAIAHVDPVAEAQPVADGLPRHRGGATPVDLLLEARAHGCDARIARGTWTLLDDEVRGGEAVIVMLDVSLELRTLLSTIPTPRAMHWAVVSGTADDGSEVLLAARDDRHHVVARDDFLARWARSDYCMITISPRAPAPLSG